MNPLINSIQQLFQKKLMKKNELFALLTEYVQAANKINSLKSREKLLEIKKIQNQIEEYYLPISLLTTFVDLSVVKESLIIDSMKHISEIKPEAFTFAELYATPVDKGVLLTTEKQPSSEMIRIVSYKKVNN